MHLACDNHAPAQPCASSAPTAALHTPPARPLAPAHSFGGASGGTIYHTGKKKEPDAEHMIQQQGNKVSKNAMS